MKCPLKSGNITPGDGFTLYIIYFKLNIQICITLIIYDVGKDPLRFEGGWYGVVDPPSDPTLKNILYVLSDHLSNSPIFSCDVATN